MSIPTLDTLLIDKVIENDKEVPQLTHSNFNELLKYVDHIVIRIDHLNKRIHDLELLARVEHREYDIGRYSTMSPFEVPRRDPYEDYDNNNGATTVGTNSPNQL